GRRFQGHMGAITVININNLFWLGRYTERVFTTLNSFFKYSDRMIEGDENTYRKYLKMINVPDIYRSKEDFFDRYVFDKSDPNSIRSNLERALGNGMVLREEIKTPSLSYLQMALDRLDSRRGTDKLRYDLLPVRDALYAFWGSVDNNMTDAEARRMIHLGKSVERVDMYMRLNFPAEDIISELDNLLKHISRYAEGGSKLVNSEAFGYLKTADIMGNIPEATENIEKLIEVNFFEETSL
ncbi:MAG: alpha-E domain-containing protein, partial [Ruminococcus sp.]|nr:alpha-E domain-containing protein [Ruminococcus sp.]